MRGGAPSVSELRMGAYSGPGANRRGNAQSAPRPRAAWGTDGDPSLIHLSLMVTAPAPVQARAGTPLTAAAQGDAETRWETSGSRTAGRPQLGLNLNEALSGV